MAGMKYNITRKYSKESFMKQNNNGRKKVRMSFLRIWQQNTRNQKVITNGHPSNKIETRNKLSPGNGSISKMMRLGMPSRVINSLILIEPVLFKCRIRDNCFRRLRCQFLEVIKYHQVTLKTMVRSRLILPPPIPWWLLNIDITS